MCGKNNKAAIFGTFTLFAEREYICTRNCGGGVGGV